LVWNIPAEHHSQSVIHRRRRCFEILLVRETDIIRHIQKNIYLLLSLDEVSFKRISIIFDLNNRRPEEKANTSFLAWV